MKTYLHNHKADQHHSSGTAPAQGRAVVSFTDNRPQTMQMKQLQDVMNSSVQGREATWFQQTANRHAEAAERPVQRKENNMGLPNNLKTGIENLSGYAMDDVKVHYNSGKPAQLHAHAYAQGTDIHLAPGQEKHLPHEAWHVVQQKQSRVKPTRQLKSAVGINDDKGLEQEADIMGARALSHTVQLQGFSAGQAAAINPVAPGAVVQRMLQITDDGKHFTNKGAAELYLTAEYKKELGKSTASTALVRDLNPAETERLKEIAEVADEARYVYPIATLSEAMQYIASGHPINVQKHDLLPDQTPERQTDDAAPWNFVLHQSYQPGILEVPQSPLHQTFFPEQSTSSPGQVDVKSGIADERSRIDTWQQQIPKTHKGNNHYAYQLEIKYRLDKLQAFTDLTGSTSYMPSSQSGMYGASKHSRRYTSKKNLPPQKKGEKPTDMEDEMRDVLTHLHTHYDRDKFKDTSLFASDKKTGVRTKTAQHYQNAKIGQISSLYFHSEVQAASDEEGAKEIAQQAVQHLVMEAIGKKKGGDYNLVVTAGIIMGYSDNRTVCGNACKPALAHLSDIIAAEMAAELRVQKNNAIVKLNELHIRRSSMFRVSAHVGAGVEFQGLKTGAELGTAKPTTLPHHSVNEYKPF